MTRYGCRSSGSRMTESTRAGPPSAASRISADLGVPSSAARPASAPLNHADHTPLVRSTRTSRYGRRSVNHYGRGNATAGPRGRNAPRAPARVPNTAPSAFDTRSTSRGASAAPAGMAKWTSAAAAWWMSNPITTR